MSALTTKADPNEQRITEIKALVDSLKRETLFNNIETDFNLTLPNPAAAFKISEGQYLISINKSIFGSLSEAAQNFIGFHELGHIYLRHSDIPSEIKNRYEVELEADIFAAYAYIKFAVIDQRIFDFIDTIASKKGTNPPGEKRAQHILNILKIKQKP